MKSGDIVIKEAIGIGDNEVDALNDAKKQLGLDENAEVDFEVIQRAEKKNSATQRYICLRYCLQ
mgnify:CR=1 FL=1